MLGISKPKAIARGISLCEGDKEKVFSYLSYVINVGDEKRLEKVKGWINEHLVQYLNAEERVMVEEWLRSQTGMKEVRVLAKRIKLMDRAGLSVETILNILDSEGIPEAVIDKALSIVKES